MSKIPSASSTGTAPVMASTHTRTDVPEDVKPLLVSVVEAAKLLGIGKTLAWDLVLQGEIPSIRLGTRRLVPRHEIVKMVYKNE